MEETVYDERFLTRRIQKLRSILDSDDPESVKFIGDNQLAQEVTKVGFYLGDVSSWESFNDPFDKFDPKPTIWIAIHFYDGTSGVYLEDFDKFDKIMVEFVTKRNPQLLKEL